MLAAWTLGLLAGALVVLFARPTTTFPNLVLKGKLSTEDRTVEEIMAQPLSASRPRRGLAAVVACSCGLEYSSAP